MLKKMLGINTGIHTIILARLYVFGGIVLGAIQALDWTQLVTLAQMPSFNFWVFLRTAVIMVAQGVGLELLRRYKATDIPQ